MSSSEANMVPGTTTGFLDPDVVCDLERTGSFGGLSEFPVEWLRFGNCGGRSIDVCPPR